MAKHFDWEKANRRDRTRLHGIAYAFDDIPPVGSYADVLRFLNRSEEVVSAKSVKANKHRTRYKNKKTPEQRIANILRTLTDMVDLPNQPRWEQNGQAYQQRVLSLIASTLNSLERRSAASLNHPVAQKARALLAKYQNTVINLS